jgi:hypothetical protein
VSEPCVSLLLLSGQGAQGAAYRRQSEQRPSAPLSSPLGQMPWPLYLMPWRSSPQDEESSFLTKILQCGQFCLGKHQPYMGNAFSVLDRWSPLRC